MSIEFSNFLLYFLECFGHFVVDFLVDFVIGEKVDDGVFVDVLMFAYFLLDGLVDVGVYDSGVATDVHLSLQLSILTH